MVVPQRHDKNHSTLHGSAHLSRATLCLEVGVVTESGLLSITEGLGDRVVLLGHASDVRHGVGNDLPVLNVEALDFL